MAAEHPAASPSRIQSLRGTLRIAQLDANDDTNPTWDDFDQALATVDALPKVNAASQVEFDKIDMAFRWLRAWLAAREGADPALDVLSDAQDALAVLSPEAQVGFVRQASDA